MHLPIPYHPLAPHPLGTTTTINGTSCHCYLPPLPYAYVRASQNYNNLLNTITVTFLQTASCLTAHALAGLPPPTSSEAMPFFSQPAPLPPLLTSPSATITTLLPSSPSQSLITVPLAACLLSHPAPCSASPFDAPSARLHRSHCSPSNAFPCCSPLGSASLPLKASPLVLARFFPAFTIYIQFCANVCLHPSKWTEQNLGIICDRLWARRVRV